MDMVLMALLKKYVADSLVGAGAVKGAPCTIKSITEITGGNRITFSWTDTDEEEHTSTLDVMNGADGADGADGQNGADGLGIKAVDVDDNNHLIATYDDDTTEDAGAIHPFTPSQITMLEGILRAAVYTSDQSSAITAFIASLSDEPITLESISAVVLNTTVEQDQTYVPIATVTAHYSDASTADVTASAQFSSIDTSTTGTKTLTISYTEDGVTETTTETITVTSEPVPKTLSSISATKTKTSYTVGETFSTDDVVVTAYYSDSTSAVVTSSATIGTVDTSTSGSKTLNISYTEDDVTKTTTIAITVESSGDEITWLSKKMTNGAISTDSGTRLVSSELIPIDEFSASDSTLTMQYACYAQDKSVIAQDSNWVHTLDETTIKTAHATAYYVRVMLRTGSSSPISTSDLSGLSISWNGSLVTG